MNDKTIIKLLWIANITVILIVITAMENYCNG